MLNRWRLTSSCAETFLVARWSTARDSEQRQALPATQASMRARDLLERASRWDLCDIYGQCEVGVDFTRLSDGDLIQALCREIASGQLLLVPQPEEKWVGMGLPPLPLPIPKELAEPAATDWISLRCVDTDGKPLAGASYVLTLPDGREIRDKLDSGGRLRVDGIPGGDCKVSFPDYDTGEPAEADES